MNDILVLDSVDVVFCIVDVVFFGNDECVVDEVDVFLLLVVDEFEEVLFEFEVVLLLFFEELKCS